MSQKAPGAKMTPLTPLSAEDEAFFRQFVFPEEDRHLFTTAPWTGEYRWFRSPNVIPLEQWRGRRVGVRGGGGRQTAV
jgi:hypothetical protein